MVDAADSAVGGVSVVDALAADDDDDGGGVAVDDDEAAAAAPVFVELRTRMVRNAKQSVSVFLNKGVSFLGASRVVLSHVALLLPAAAHNHEWRAV